MADDCLHPKPLSLLGAASFTLANKMQRDGIVEFVKALIQLCFAEPPLAAIARHSEVVAFFDQPSMAPLKPRPIANKYLSGYLAKSLGKRARRDVLLHHYRCIADRAAPAFLQRVLNNSYELWSHRDGSVCHSIALAFNESSDYEGDLSLVFTSGTQRIFDISFTIVPGSAIGSDASELLFVGRVQGVKHKLAEVKAATRACKNAAPQEMLMVALGAIAQALGIAAIAGVTEDNQLANLPNKDFRFAYNAFWENWDGRKASHFYEILATLPPAPDIKARNRQRRRKKHEFKREAGLAIAGKLEAIFPGRLRSAA